VAGDRAILARAITLIESTRPDHEERARELMELCLPHTGRSVRVAITGVPGSGKSTFIEALGLHLIRELGENIAVLAIDPSSPVSGGSILGDKTRMPRLSADDRAFIRPSASGGAWGGVAARTREAILLCEAAGFQNVIVETIGVGQSEVAAASMVDFFLLLMLAGAGDDLQGIKRGVLELADLVAFNKADGDNKPRAEAARKQLEGALDLFPPQASGWKPPVVTCSARTGEGVVRIWNTVVEHRERMRANGEFERKRRQQVREAMYETIRRKLSHDFFARSDVKSRLPQIEDDLVAGRVTPYAAAIELMRK